MAKVPKVEVEYAIGHRDRDNQVYYGMCRTHFPDTQTDEGEVIFYGNLTTDELWFQTYSPKTYGELKRLMDLYDIQ